MTAKLKKLQVYRFIDSNGAQTVQAKPPRIRFLHAEESSVARASLVSREVTMRQGSVMLPYKVVLRVTRKGRDVLLL